jgi:hypothetical protein
MASSLLSLFVLVVLGIVGGGARADVPLNTTVGMFGPLSAYQPFDNWLYPPSTAIPLCISLGNASLALYLPSLSPNSLYPSSGISVISVPPHHSPLNSCH